MISYERYGIPAIVITLRREVAALASAKFDELLGTYTAAGTGDPERMDTLREIAVMMREVLSGSDPQVLPLSNEGASFLESWFGRTS